MEGQNRELRECVLKTLDDRAGYESQHSRNIEIPDVRARRLISVFLLRKEHLVLQDLVELAEKIPWLAVKVGGSRIPLVVIIQQILNENTEAPKDLTERTQRLVEELQSVHERLQSLQESGAVTRDVLLELWAKRQLLPKWGRILWEPLIAAGETAWIKDALQDPWMTDERRAALRELLRKSAIPDDIVQRDAVTDGMYA